MNWEELIETKLPKLESDDLGAESTAWLRAHLFLDEAQALIQQPAVPGK